MTINEFIKTIELKQRKEIGKIQWDLSETKIYDKEDFPQKLYWKDAVIKYAKGLNIEINENNTNSNNGNMHVSKIDIIV